MLFLLLDGCQLNTSQNRYNVLTFALTVASKVAICQAVSGLRQAGKRGISYNTPTF